MSTRMQNRRGTAAQWISLNDGDGPILAAGEIGYETDTNKFKIGDGINHWIDLTYFLDADTAYGAITGIIDGAPDLLNTLNELAAAIGDDPAFITTIGNNLTNHQLDTTNIHGITDTAELATKTFAAELLTNSTKTNITITGDKNGLTITAENGVADSTTDNLTEGSTNKYFTDERAQDAIGNNVGTGLSYNDSTGAISVTAMTYDAYGTASQALTDANAYTDAEIAAIDALPAQGGNNGKFLTTDGSAASWATVDLSTKQDVVSGVSSIEIGYLDGVSSSIQTQLDAKFATANASTTNISEGTNLYFTDERAQDAIGTILGTGLSYNDAGPGIGIDNAALTTYLLDGASGNSYGLIGTSEYLDIKNTNGYNKEIELDITSVEAKLVTDGFAKTASPTFTGTVSGITKLMVGLGNVDNTADADKPVSDDTQAALDLKADLAGPTLTGTTTVDDLEIGGSLTFSGTATQINQTDLTLEDPMIYLAEGNTANINDIGFVGAMDDGTYQHVGLVRDASEGTWKLFKGVTDEPTTTVNFGQGSLDNISVGGLVASSITVGDVSNTEFGYLNGVTSGIQTQLDTKLASATAASTYAPLASPTFTGTVTLPNLTVTNAMLAGSIANAKLSNSAITINSTSISLGDSKTFNTPVLTWGEVKNGGKALVIA